MEVKEFYDNIAKDYDNLRYGRRYYKQVAQLELEFIERYLKWGKCLEVGAGTGRVTEFLLKNTEAVVAADISPQMVEQLMVRLKGYNNLIARVHDIYELDKIESYGNFDCAVCLRILSHLKRPLEALRGLSGSVARDGMVIFDMWNSWGYDAVAKRLKLRPSAVFTRYATIGKMLMIIEDSGLAVEARRGFGFPPFNIFMRLEENCLSALDYLAQRIVWVCRPIQN